MAVAPRTMPAAPGAQTKAAPPRPAGPLSVRQQAAKQQAFSKGNPILPGFGTLVITKPFKYERMPKAGWTFVPTMEVLEAKQDPAPHPVTGQATQPNGAGQIVSPANPLDKPDSREVAQGNLKKYLCACFGHDAFTIDDETYLGELWDVFIGDPEGYPPVAPTGDPVGVIVKFATRWHCTKAGKWISVTEYEHVDEAHGNSPEEIEARAAIINSGGKVSDTFGK